MLPNLYQHVTIVLQIGPPGVNHEDKGMMAKVRFGNKKAGPHY